VIVDLHSPGASDTRMSEWASSNFKHCNLIKTVKLSKRGYERFNNFFIAHDIRNTLFDLT